MRLINTRSMRLESKEGRFGSYAILSHTWGDDEVLFKDIEDPETMRWLREKETAAFAKVRGTCVLAARRHISHVWIDTCCIDKSSSAELSEAINSMFQWYGMAKVCWAYLSDVTVLPDGAVEGFKESRWFTRGWTLQELLAPTDVEFFDRNWKPLGTRTTLAEQISEITGIEKHLLLENTYLKSQLRSVNIATRMSWAARRQTTRVEDMAYCLMGLFDVNMPLLYGEGKKAFARLQEEILKVSQDQSLLIWRRWDVAPRHTDLMPFFANSPACFNVHTFGRRRATMRSSMRLAPTGLEIRAWVVPCTCIYGAASSNHSTSTDRFLAVLECNMSSDTLAQSAILLDAADSRPRVYRRAEDNIVLAIEPGSCTVKAFVEHPLQKKLNESQQLKSVKYSEKNFEEVDILLEIEQGTRNMLLPEVPIKMTLKSEDGLTRQIASFSVFENGLHTSIRRGTGEDEALEDLLCGAKFFTSGEGVDFVLWWGVVVVKAPVDDDSPRIWNECRPVCYIGTMKNEGYNAPVNADRSERIWKKSSYYGSSHWLRRRRWAKHSKKALNQTGSVIAHEENKYTINAAPSGEYRVDGVKITTSIRTEDFLGRTVCYLEVNVASRQKS